MLDRQVGRVFQEIRNTEGEEKIGLETKENATTAMATISLSCSVLDANHHTITVVLLAMVSIALPVLIMIVFGKPRPIAFFVDLSMT